MKKVEKSVNRKRSGNHTNLDSYIESSLKTLEAMADWPESKLPNLVILGKKFVKRATLFFKS